MTARCQALEQGWALSQQHSSLAMLHHVAGQGQHLPPMWCSSAGPATGQGLLSADPPQIQPPIGQAQRAAAGCLQWWPPQSCHQPAVSLHMILNQTNTKCVEMRLCTVLLLTSSVNLQHFCCTSGVAALTHAGRENMGVHVSQPACLCGHNVAVAAVLSLQMCH